MCEPAVSATAPPPTGLRRYVSVLDGILPYQRAWLSKDIVAGVTLAALAIPEVMGYTKIAGMPVITGLYTILMPDRGLRAARLVAASRRRRATRRPRRSCTAGIVALGIGGLQPASPQWVGARRPAPRCSPAAALPGAAARASASSPTSSRAPCWSASSRASACRSPPDRSPACSGSPSRRRPWTSSAEPRSRSSRRSGTSATRPGTTSLVSVVGARHPHRLRSLAEGDPRRPRRRGRHDRRQLDLRPRRRTTSRRSGPVPSGLPHLGCRSDVTWHDVRTLLATAVSMFLVILAQSAATSRAYAVEVRRAVRREHRSRRPRRREPRRRLQRHVRRQRQPDQDRDGRRGEEPHPGRPADDGRRRRDRRCCSSRSRCSTCRTRCSPRSSS